MNSHHERIRDQIIHFLTKRGDLGLRALGVDDVQELVGAHTLPGNAEVLRDGGPQLLDVVLRGIVPERFQLLLVVADDALVVAVLEPDDLDQQLLSRGMSAGRFAEQVSHSGDQLLEAVLLHDLAGRSSSGDANSGRLDLPAQHGVDRPVGVVEGHGLGEALLLPEVLVDVLIATVESADSESDSRDIGEVNLVVTSNLSDRVAHVLQSYLEADDVTIAAGVGQHIGNDLLLLFIKYHYMRSGSTTL